MRRTLVVIGVLITFGGVLIIRWRISIDAYFGHLSDRVGWVDHESAPVKWMWLGIALVLIGTGGVVSAITMTG